MEQVKTKEKKRKPRQSLCLLRLGLADDCACADHRRAATTANADRLLVVSGRESGRRNDGRGLLLLGLALGDANCARQLRLRARAEALALACKAKTHKSCHSGQHLFIIYMGWLLRDPKKRIKKYQKRQLFTENIANRINSTHIHYPWVPRKPNPPSPIKEHKGNNKFKPKK